MAYAINKINRDLAFLPNTTLGFVIYDTCLSSRKAIEGILWMMTGRESSIPNYQSENPSTLAAVIGESSSTVSISIARLLGLHRYPQVSYFSTSPLLNNKDQYPSFFRTIPSDDIQARGLAQLVLHFGWTWVGLLANEDDYGLLGSQIVKKELLKAGVCVAFHESIPIAPSSTKVNAIVETVVNSHVNVIIAFCTAPYLIFVVRALNGRNITGKVWIASEGWSSTSRFSPMEFAKLMGDTIGFTVHDRTIPGFKDFLLKVHPSDSNNDIFVKRFWEQVFGCQWPVLKSNLTTIINGLTEDSTQCTGHEKLEQFKDKYQDEPDLRICYVIYNAVSAVIHALKNMLSCVPGHGPFTHDTCANLSNFRPWQLLHYMKHVQFRSTNGEEVSFDSNGRPPARYDIINWQRGLDGAIRLIKVGIFDTKAPNGQQLYVNSSALLWTKQDRKVPPSFCSESCLPGFRKVAQMGPHVCCFDCIQCSEGEMSEELDSSNCWPCPIDQWPNDGRSKCVAKTIEFLSFQEPLGVTLTVAVLLCSSITVIILWVFTKYQDTPIVKANNRALSYLLLGLLVVSFLSSLLFVGEPQSMTCLIRQPTFGIIFVFCISCVLAKTIMVVIAFNATMPGSSMRNCLGPQIPLVTVSGCTSLQVIICATWILLCPPFTEKNMKLKTGTIILQCNECSETAFWFMLAYMGLLACVSFLVAYVARKLPDSFNEAKWITFSMLVFLSVWLSFIPGYLSTQGKYMVAMEVFGIVSSSAGLLTFIFVPKCYILLLRPNLNTREYLLGKGRASAKNDMSS
ncbi:extracellular calcium-sensing receptor-like [Ambystoma mexicanum]|uniref:extracellular calcium-sensing receptor-like n=1 Tax=Ambystoma mexicanum TaxID=8296 RepID=UPI0037E94285